MRRLFLIAAAASLGATALAHGAPGTIQATRHDGFKAMGGAMKAIGDQLKSGAADKAVVVRNAETIAATAPKIPGWFPKGSGPESGQKTAAKAEIWSNWGEFKKDADALKTESAKLVTVARAGDMDGVGAQMKATGAACGACHKAFRAKEE